MRRTINQALTTLWQAACGKAVQPPNPKRNPHENCLRGLLQEYPPRSPEVCAAVKARLDEYTRPALKIIDPEIWNTHLEGYPYGHPTVKTHLKSDFGDIEFSDTISNISNVNKQVLSATEEKYLRLLLTHSCGWSSTYHEHANDDWVKYLRVNYSLPGLTPILDSLMYKEELVDFPLGLKEWVEPSLFLLATTESYYVYFFIPDEGSGLFKAGNTLEEVYVGVKEYRHFRYQEGCWEELENNPALKYSYDERAYFPVYYRKNRWTCDDGEFCLEEELKEFPSQLDHFGKNERESGESGDM